MTNWYKSSCNYNIWQLFIEKFEIMTSNDFNKKIWNCKEKVINFGVK